MDDRDLRASASWRKGSGRNYYLGTFVGTTRKTASLTARELKGRDLYVIARVCRRCGRIKVILNGRRVGTVDLKSRRARNKRLLRVARFPRKRSGVVEIVVISTGARVKIDGLALS